MMAEKKITREEQSCIGGCINKYWGQASGNIQNEDQRDEAYEKCLSSCQVCG